MHRIQIMNCPADVATLEETCAIIRSRILERKFTQHVVVNVAKLVSMQKDLALYNSVSSCDIINIDGMGVVYASRVLGHKVPERVTGIDLFYKLINMSEAESLPIYLLGARDEVITEAVSRLKEKYPSLKIAGFHHGYFWDNEAAVVESIKKSGARLLFVAITSPKKENFINKWSKYLGVDFVMGVGGTFDVVAGRVKRAPMWMQKVGLEWLFRVIQEPQRMWKRYLLTNSKFLLMLAKEKLTKHI